MDEVAMVAVAHPAQMFDVDYLLDPQAVTRPIVYRYRTGVLLSAVHQALAGAADQQGSSLMSYAPLEFHGALSGWTLFDDTIPYCYWPRRKTRTDAKHAEHIVRTLVGDDSRPGILFAHVEDSIFNQSDWSRASQRLLVLDEAVASPETVGRIVDYLFVVTDLPSCPIDRCGLIRHFEIVLEQEGCEGFVQFARRFDTAMLLHCDPGTGAFTPPPANLVDPSERSYVMAPLRRLVEDQREEAMDDLVVNLGVRLRTRGQEPATVLSSICDLTTMLLEFGGVRTQKVGLRKGAGRPRVDPDVVLWCVVLLVWGRRMLIAQSRVKEKLIPAADSNLILFDQMVRDFYTRAASPDQSNPILDLWPDIQVILREYSAKGPLIPRDQARGQVIAALGAHLVADKTNSLRPSWIAQLHQQVLIAVEARKTMDEDAS